MTAPEFEHLIAPVALGEFLDKYWETQPLRAERSDPEHYDEIISIAAIDRLFRSRQHGAEFIRVIANGQEVPQSQWAEPITLRDGRSAHVADFAKVIGHFHKGASIVINGAHRSVPELRQLCERLTEELGFSLQANIYITPSESRAFKPHYDLHDAFLLQISGNKRWRIYHRAADYPVIQAGVDLETLPVDDPAMEFSLTSGDALYIPSGFIHAATTSDRASIHVTLGFKPKRRYELLEDALAAARAQPELRKALPLKLLSHERQTTEWNEVRVLLDGLWGSLWDGQHETAFSVENTVGAEPAIASLSEAIRIDEITADSLVAFVPEVVVDKQSSESEIIMRAGSHEVMVARIFEPTINGLQMRKPLVVGDFDGLLTEAGKVEFAKSLARSGVVEILRD